MQVVCERGFAGGGATEAGARAELGRTGLTGTRNDSHVAFTTFLFEGGEPRVDGKAEEEMSSVLAESRVGGGPIVIARDAVEEVEAAVDEDRRRVHFLSDALEFSVRRIEGGDGFAIFAGNLDPLIVSYRTYFFLFDSSHVVGPFFVCERELVS